MKGGATAAHGDPGLGRWTPICRIDRIEPDRGVAALVDGNAVAVFVTSFDGEVRAIGDVDPFSGASVLSRGLVGWAERNGRTVPYVASPLRKQRFDLTTGEAWDDPSVSAGRYAARILDGLIEVCPER